MTDAIKSEFRKLLTTRWTYIVLGFVMVLVVIFAFIAQGIMAKPPGGIIGDSNYLASQTRDGLVAVAGILSIVSVLLVANEYRYNTIMYTLTASKSRMRVFASKLLVVLVWGAVTALIVAATAPLLTWLGLQFNVNHATIVHQSYPYLDYLWKSIFIGVGFSAFAYAFAVMIRNQIGAVIAVFVGPGVLESLLGILLKDNSIYLPYSALESVISGPSRITTGRAVEVVLAYVIVFMLAAWQLFHQRDAN